MTRWISRRNALTLIGGSTAAAVTAAIAPTNAQAPAVVPTKSVARKVAFVLGDVPGKVGWDREHMRGIDMARAAFGAGVQIDAFFAAEDSARDTTERLNELAQEGYELIFGCAPSFGTSLVDAALIAPQTKFEHCGGFVRSDNMATYSARWYEGRMPQGLIAGAVTKTNRVGYMASHQSPQAMRGINAAYLAARAINPDVVFDVIWVNAALDPEREDMSARLLVQRGADVLFSDTRSVRPTQVAQALGVHAFGQTSDMSGYGQDSALTATVDNWGPYYVSRIRALLEDRWEGTDTWGGFADDMITMARFGPDVPPAAREAANELVVNLKQGLISPFEGPIRTADGAQWLRQGQWPTDVKLQKMDFLVPGLLAPLG